MCFDLKTPVGSRMTHSNRDLVLTLNLLLGHYFNVGRMHEAMVEVLGIDEVAFFRLRRDRYSTIHSQNGTLLRFVIRNNRNAILQATDEQWNRLTKHQQYLWAIDELEAKWQRLLATYPQMHALELNWKSTISPSSLRALGRLLECRFPPRPPHAHNHNNVITKQDMEDHIRSDREYQDIMQYTEDQKRMIAMVQF